MPLSIHWQRIRTGALALFLLCAQSGAAWGSSLSRGYGGGNRVDRALSQGAGVAAPALDTALIENPAGLAFTPELRIQLVGGSENRLFNDATYGGMLVFGQENVGAGFGVFNGSRAQFGIAAMVPSVSTAFGVSTFANLENGQTDMNLGAIVAAGSDLRLGAALYGALEQVDALGFGLATELNASSTFAVDLAASGAFSDVGIKPSLGIHLPKVQMVMGYGIDFREDSPSWIRTGISMAIGVSFGSAVQLSAYFNQIALYYLSLGVTF